VAVQVDPIKPTLKAPGTKRLKLKHDEPLSNFAFKFNLRRYTKETTWGPLEEVIAVGFAYTFKISARDRFGTLITTHSDVSAFSLRFDGRGFHSSTFTLS